MSGSTDPLRRNVRAALGGEFVQVALSVVLFFGLAWRLSDVGFGYFVAVNAAGLIIGTFANLGAQEVLVREVSRGGSLADEWGLTLATQLIGATVGMAVGLAVRPLFFSGLSASTVALLLLVNMVFFWTVEGCVRCASAVRQLATGTRARLWFAVGRVAGVVAFVATGSDELSTYAMVSLPFAIAGTAMAVREVATVAGRWPRLRRPARGRVAEGLPFIGSAGAQDMLAAFDRPLLSGFGFVVEAGHYGIADRVMRLGGVPTMSVVRATQADFFEIGAIDRAHAFELAKQHVRLPALYGIGVVLAALAFWPVGEFLVPERFEAVVPMLVALSFLPLTQALQVFPANMLTGSDHEPVRLALYAGAVVMNVVLNLVLIPDLGWTGAAIATAAAEFSLAAALWIAARRVSVRPIGA